MNIRAIFGYTVFSLCALNAIASGAATQQELVQQCADCHGEHGNSEKSAIPTIAGISASYFKDTMGVFAAGDRPAETISRDGEKDTDMAQIAKQLSAAEIELLAKYYAEQTFVRTAQPFDAAKAKEGNRVHRKYCEKCHEDDGRSKEDDGGILAGQKMEYLTETLRQIRAGGRPMGKKMKKKIDAVTEDEGEAGFDHLVHHYGSQM